jgi:hypothetical protein
MEGGNSSLRGREGFYWLEGGQPAPGRGDEERRTPLNTGGTGETAEHKLGDKRKGSIEAPLTESVSVDT